MIATTNLALRSVLGLPALAALAFAGFLGLEVTNQVLLALIREHAAGPGLAR